MNLTRHTLDFEKPIADLELKIEELERYNGTASVAAKRSELKKKLAKMQKEVYAGLTTWQRVQLARHPNRPYTEDYLDLVCDEWVELHGDRRFADDASIMSGLAMIDGRPVVVIGQQRGRTTKDKIKRNFGSTHPEGYRKALRVMKLAEKLNKPVLTLVDTAGAYPGVGAEERGQAEAIAYNIQQMTVLEVPIVSVVIGEGGSGGALGIGVADRVLMMENSMYSVISPEGCASILWKDKTKAPEAAEVLKLTAQPLKRLGIVDGTVPEPVGGAHKDFEKAAGNLKKAVLSAFDELEKLSLPELLDQRLEKYAGMGKWVE